MDYLLWQLVIFVLLGRCWRLYRVRGRVGHRWLFRNDVWHIFDSFAFLCLFEKPVLDLHSGTIELVYRILVSFKKSLGFQKILL